MITFSCSDEMTASAGEPIFATTVGPEVSWPKICAARGAVNVTIESARATLPCCDPFNADIASASAPEGISTATTGTPLAFIICIASA